MTIFTDKAKTYVPRLMKDLSITRMQACGIFGNFGGETGGFAALQETKPIIAGSRGGYGWLQWTGPRRRKYESWCKANRVDPAVDESNYKYFVLETSTDEKHSLEQLRKTTTVESATETFMLLNLRPGKPNLQGRINWAQKAYVASEPVLAPTNPKINTAVIVATTGGVIASQVTPTHPHLWPWIIGITLMAGLVTWTLVHFYRKNKNV